MTMKPIVLGITRSNLKMNVLKNIFGPIIIFFIFLCYCPSQAQQKYEREFRILKSQFPTEAITLINNNVQHVKRLKYYKEVDSSTTRFEAKFKKDKLWYGIEFNEKGILERIQIVIKPTDIPNDTYIQIKDHLNNIFTKFRIRKIQQQYSSKNSTIEETFKNAFQNLILPSISYEIQVSGKKAKGNIEYELIFNADGKQQHTRTALPQNYDRILYE